MDDKKTVMKLWWLRRQAARLKIDWGWLWLFRNGFRHRVPPEIREKIEDEKSIKISSEIIGLLKKKDLPSRRRLIVHLKDKCGFTFTRIAEKVGLCVASVWRDYKIEKGEYHD